MTTLPRFTDVDCMTITNGRAFVNVDLFELEQYIIETATAPAADEMAVEQAEAEMAEAIWSVEI